MRRVAASALVAIAGCGDPKEPTPVAGSHDVFRGAVVVDGKPVTMTACKPGHSAHVFIEVVTGSGKLRFEDQRLYWNPAPDSITRGDALTCSKLDRSWGGGNRNNGTSYWRGSLAFACVDERGARFAGDLVLDCGDITAEERTELDRNSHGSGGR